jgi:hypothetical protein
MEIMLDGRRVVAAPVSQLKRAYEMSLERALHTDKEERLVPDFFPKS